MKKDEVGERFINYEKTLSHVLIYNIIIFNVIQLLKKQPY